MTISLDELNETSLALVSEGRGILAADESTGTITKRFDSIHVESTPESRLDFRELLFSTLGAEKYISGVILYDETIRQKSSEGSTIPGVLRQKGILPGIKVDKGARPLPGFPGETITEGLDGLRERLREYRELGARFAKWRAVFFLEAGIPSEATMEANAVILAIYAAHCQEAGLVPIVEPEVLMNGDHTLERCEEATREILVRVFRQLHAHRVFPEGMLLKPNMIVPGNSCPEQASTEEIAEATVRCLRRTVPAAVPGIVFLSGGQNPEAATERLNAINRLGRHPWQTSFSFSRALQEPVLGAWEGHKENAHEAQRIFLKRLEMNSVATLGEYSPDLEEAPAAGVMG